MLPTNYQQYVKQSPVFSAAPFEGAEPRLPDGACNLSPAQAAQYVRYQQMMTKQAISPGVAAKARTFSSNDNNPTTTVQQQKVLMSPLAGLANILSSKGPSSSSPSLSKPVAVPASQPGVSENALNNILMNSLPFGSYWPNDMITHLAQRGLLILGPLRVNVKDYTQSFVPHPTESVDIAIPGVTLRNGALSGDICAVQILTLDKITNLMPQSEVQQYFFAKSNGEAEKQSRPMYGRIVGIMRKVHSRTCAGTLKKAPAAANGPDAFLLSPVDSRIPRVLIPKSSIPSSVQDSLSRYSDMLFLAELTDWPDARFARGKLRQQIGNIGELKSESDAILWSIGIDPDKINKFGADVENNLPPADWQPPQSEISYRLDLRQSCIFTCDPASARDLDDAVSCELLPCGVFEVSVHIADVSYFVREGSPLDTVAKERATSTYLTERMVPMLPQRLSADLCSLNEGVDRLTVSVIWHLDPAGNVLSEWIGRTIIRSCCKLNYEVAMDIIDEKSEVPMPTVHGAFTADHIKQRLKWLNSLTQSLRQRRIASGAVSLHQTKLRFTLSQEAGEPIGFQTYKRMASNELIEELMLLANMAVARKLLTRFPDLAVLRRHPAPQKEAAKKVVEQAAKMNVPLDFTSSGTLSASLNLASGVAKIVALNSVIRVNQLAMYFRAVSGKSGNFSRHYALACDCYTHFTSPIRRYADILVHRQLVAACYNTCSPGQPAELDKMLRVCNERKQLARNASDESSKLYYSALLREIGSMKDQAVVVGCLDRAFEVLILSTGMTARIYVDALFASLNPNKTNAKGVSTAEAEENNPNVVKFSKLDETLHITLHVPSWKLKENHDKREETESKSRLLPSSSFFAKQKSDASGALFALVIRPMVVIDAIIRHAPKTGQPLKWEAVLDTSVFL